MINALGHGVANVRGWSNVSGFSDLTDGSGYYAINNAAVGSNFVQITGTTGFPDSPGSAPAFNPEFRLPILPPSAVNQDFIWKDDNPCRAIYVQPGVNYAVNRTDPDDAYDFLRLNVTGTTPLVITMTNVQSPGSSAAARSDQEREQWQPHHRHRPGQQLLQGVQPHCRHDEFSRT